MKEIQVVILIDGYGYSLFPLTEKQYKHLLPIANKPLLAYVVEKLQSHYFTNFVFVCNKENKNDVERYFEEKFVWSKKIPKTTYYYAPERYLSSTQALADLCSNYIITKDILLINGDLLTSCNLNNLLDHHYVNDNDITAVIMDSKESECLIVADDEQNMLKITDKEELRFKGLYLRSSIVHRNLAMKTMSNKDLAHIFIINKDLFNVLPKLSEKFHNFSDELIPFLVEHQYNKKLLKEIHKLDSNNTDDDAVSQNVSVDQLEDMRYRINCYLLEGYNRRVNSLKEYIQINFEALSMYRNSPVFQFTENNEGVLPPNSEDKNKGQGNIISLENDISDKAIIKRCIVAKNCKIGKSQLKNCIVLKDTIIEDDCNLENCFIGARVIIHSKCKLVDCTVADYYTVREHSNVTNEVFITRDSQEVEVIRKNSTQS